MPSYVYKCSNGCGYVRVVQSLSDEPLELCPARCGAPARRAIVAGNLPQTNTDNPIIDGGYISQLARYPNDPEAHVSGVDSRRRLIDKRQRQGYEVLTGNSAHEDRAPRDIKRAERQSNG